VHKTHTYTHATAEVKNNNIKKKSGVRGECWEGEAWEGETGKEVRGGTRAVHGSAEFKLSSHCGRAKRGSSLGPWEEEGCACITSHRSRPHETRTPANNFLVVFSPSSEPVRTQATQLDPAATIAKRPHNRHARTHTETSNNHKQQR
jgi:hypothetical protein